MTHRLCFALLLAFTGLTGVRGDSIPLPKFQLAEGLAITRVAGAPQIKFPMFAAFDDRGRLFVTESSGGDLYAEASRLAPTCRVSVLEDHDGDGSFEDARVFADKLVMPMGIVWCGGKLYVANCSELIALEDTDGDGRADQRTVILSGFGHSDNGSLHGLIFGPDGLLYMTVGQPDGYRFKNARGEEVHGKTGALIRCRADGSHPEVLCRGFENLVEIVFLPTGEIIGTVNWFQLPSGGVRDALVHLVEGGKYPRMADDGSPLPITGGDLPAVAKFPAVAVSGLTQIRGDHFPPELRGHLLSAQHNSRVVQRHALSREGSTFRSDNHAFVTSDDPDFHPSDVLEAPDGSVLIVDTGGWYVQHCPTGKIRDSYATGGIYRVRNTAAKSSEQTPGVDPLWSAPVEDVRVALEKGDSDTAALAARILGSRAERAAGRQLAGSLKSEAPHVRMAAAEALAQCGDASALPAIWAALGDASDVFIEHALTYAAFRLAERPALETALTSSDPRVQKAALLLLDQPPHATLSYSAVAERLAASDPHLQQTAMSILQRHPEWAGAAAGFIRDSLHRDGLGEEENLRFQRLILAFQSQLPAQELIAELLTDADLPVSRRGAVLNALMQTNLREVPASWLAALRQLLETGPAELRAPVVRLAATLQLSQLDVMLSQIADDERAPAGERLDALRAIIARHPRLSASALEFLRAQLAPARDPLSRLAAAELLRRAKLAEADSAQFRQMVGDDPLVAPLLFPAPPKTSDQQRALLAGYEPLLTGGDPTRGREIYFGKALCGTCHRVGSDGGLLGPDLSKIGAIRSGRDLLESIVAPSSTFAQSFEPFIVTYREGTVLSGVIARETTDAILLRDAAGAEKSLQRETVKTLERSPVSLMPEGLDRTMTASEFRDLLAFLLSLR